MNPVLRLPVIALGATAVLLTGCSGLGTSRPAADGAGPTTSHTTAPVRDAALDDRTPVASRQASYDEALVRIDLLSLRRSGALATLRFTATNTTPGTVDDTTSRWSVNSDLGSGPAEYSVDGVYLVDPAHSKRYPTAVDAADDCVCTATLGVSVLPTRSYEFSATFAAPPADVTTVDVTVPGAGTFENVPVS